MDTISPDAAFKYQKQDPGRRRLKSRDPLIAILAIIHAIRGIWSLYYENHVFFTYLDLATFDDPDVNLWGPPLPKIVLGNLYAITILVAGIGLWFGARWAWWLAGFVYLYVVVQAGYIIAIASLRSEEFAQAGLEFDFSQYYTKLLIFSLLAAYLQIGHVLRSFGITPSFRIRSITLATQLVAAILCCFINSLSMAYILTHYGNSVPYIQRPIDDPPPP